MASVRYLAGLYGGKAAVMGLKIFRRNGSYFPGVVSMKLDPQFLRHIPKPDKMIAVTGTNGKTTTSNMILDILRKSGEDPVNNSLGSNTIHGILTALASNIDLTGKKKTETSVMEVDERFTPKIFRSVTPDILVITNIFQDSYKRNAHTDFIRKTISEGLPKGIRIVVNGDDLIASNIGPDENKVCFGMEKLDFEKESRPSRLKDLTNCPECGTPLTWDFTRYHHIGRAHCENCGFRNKEIKYKVVSADLEGRKFTVSEPLGTFQLPLVNNSIEGIYNQVAAYSALREYGMEPEKIIGYMKDLKIVESRFRYIEKKGKKIYSISAKGINPIANSRVFDTVSQVPGRKTVVIMNDSTAYDVYGEMISWLYDADFEYLNQDELNKIIFLSWKTYDFKLRALMAGIPEDKIGVTDKDEKAFSFIDIENTDNFFILHDIEDPSVARADRLIEKISARLEEK